MASRGKANEKAHIDKEGLGDRCRVGQARSLNEDAIILGLALQQLGQNTDQVATHCTRRTL